MKMIKWYENDTPPSPQSNERRFSSEFTGSLRNLALAVCSLFFVLFYGASLSGLIRPVGDITLLTRLEPLVFVLLGFYFGQWHLRQVEKILKDELSRQTRRADAVQHTKEQVEIERETLVEKIRNVRAALGPLLKDVNHVSHTARDPDGSFGRFVRAAVKILDS